MGFALILAVGIVMFTITSNANAHEAYKITGKSIACRINDLGFCLISIHKALGIQSEIGAMYPRCKDANSCYLTPQQYAKVIAGKDVEIASVIYNKDNIVIVEWN